MFRDRFSGGSTTPTPERRELGYHFAALQLLAAGGIGIQHDLGDAGMAPIDDVLDACAAALSARRFARGEAVSLPDPPEKIAGRDAAIWF